MEKNKRLPFPRAHSSLSAVGKVFRVGHPMVALMSGQRVECKTAKFWSKESKGT